MIVKWHKLCDVIDAHDQIRQVPPGPNALLWQHLDKFIQFIRQVRPNADDNCWYWTGTVDGYGYGRFTFIKRRFTHAVSWLLFRGLYDSPVMRHLCHNRVCCNPLHLEPGTQRQNIYDTVAAGRHPYGEAQGIAELSNDKVKRIRGIFIAEPWRSDVDIGKEFNISRATIYQLRNGEKWTHVEGHILPPPRPKLVRRI
jgi:hypothetical protein